MNKYSYETALYTAFFDELEKLGYDLEGIDKEAFNPIQVAKSVGQRLIPASMKMNKALRAPGATAVGLSPSVLTQASRARQLAPTVAATRAAAPISRAGRASRIANVRESLSRPVGGTSW